MEPKVKKVQVEQRGTTPTDKEQRVTQALTKEQRLAESARKAASVQNADDLNDAVADGLALD